MDKNIVIYKSGEIELKISVEKETIWLNAEDIAVLFDVQRPAIVKHIGNIYKTGELSKDSTCSILEQVAKDGKKRKKNYYNLDVIISVGYRVNSLKATKFRIWATAVLKQYIYQGYAINGEKITHQRFKDLENDVSLLKYKVNDISKALEDKIIEHGQQIYYDGQIFDAYTLIADIVRSAKEEIILIDNYIDDTVFKQLTKRNKGVKAIIYTKPLSKVVKQDLQKHNEQYPEIEVRKLNTAHDRFMIIDQKTVFHFGASLKDAGKKWFVFSKLEMPATGILEKLREKAG